MASFPRILVVPAVLLAVVGVAATAGLVWAGRGDGEGLIPDEAQPSVAPSASPTPEPTAPPARCPAGVPGCREVSGRIVYVEAVDPDGDGDAHFVLADSDGVTGPGITVVDVPPALRPDPLPGVGAHLSAAGTSETGSFGQTQIGAVALGG
jgi:hypothetical protein